MCQRRDGALHGETGAKEDAVLVNFSGFRKANRPGESRLLDKRSEKGALHGRKLFGIAHAGKVMSQLCIWRQDDHTGSDRTRPGTASGFINTGDSFNTCLPEGGFE